MSTIIMFRKRYYLPIFFIVVAVGLRVLRHYDIINLPPNFAPITAIALFAGAYLKDKRLALIIPLVAMIISDFFIGFYNIGVLSSVYLSFLIAGLIGLKLRRKRTIWRISGAALLSSILFFIITNFAVWVFSGMYMHNWAGFINSYLMALPFFRWTLLGNIFYVMILFSLYEIILIVPSIIKRKAREVPYVK